MFLKLINFPLRSGEHIISVIRQNNSKIIFPFLISFLVYLNAFFFLFKFISWGEWGLALFGFLLFLGIFYAFYKFYFWYFNAVVLTNQRIIDIYQKRFFERITSDVSYRRIKDAVVKIKGFWQILTHTGSTILVLDGGSDNLEFRHIKNPEKVRELILEIRADEAENPPCPAGGGAYSPFQKGGGGGGFASPFQKGGGFEGEIPLNPPLKKGETEGGGGGGFDSPFQKGGGFEGEIPLNPPLKKGETEGGGGGGFDSPFDKGGEGGFKNEKIRQICEEIKDLDEATLAKIYERLPEIIKEESEQLFFS